MVCSIHEAVKFTGLAWKNLPLLTVFITAFMFILYIFEFVWLPLFAFIKYPILISVFNAVLTALSDKLVLSDKVLIFGKTGLPL